MKFAVASEHRDFFQKNQAIEFEGLLTPDQLNLLRTGIDDALSKRFDLLRGKSGKLAAEKQYQRGRDLWRDSDSVKKIAANVHLAEIASELIQEKPLRLGYDQLLPVPSGLSLQNRDHGPYHAFLERGWTLEEASCLQGVLCGLILCLQDAPQEHKPSDGGSSPPEFFPYKAGNGTYFTPGAQIPFMNLPQRQGQSFLLIAYAGKSTVYVMREGDLHVHDLKRKGYVFGDKLNDKTNPIVYR